MQTSFLNVFSGLVELNFQYERWQGTFLQNHRYIKT